MEVFSRNIFPSIRKTPYVLTIGPHGHYWFVLQAQAGKRAAKKRVVPSLEAEANLQSLLADGQRAQLERSILPEYLSTCRWFGAKARTIREMRIIEQIPVAENAAQLWLLQVDYTDGAPDIYSLPVQLATGAAADALARTAPQAVIARLGPQRAVLYDAIWDADFRAKLFQMMASGVDLKGKNGHLIGVSGSLLAQEPNEKAPASQVLNAEQSNSSMLFENRFFLKLYRKLEDGVNPDVEVTRFLTERRQFAHVPAFAGAIEYRRGRGEPTVVALLQAAAPNEGDAWALTLDAVGRYFERVLARKGDLQTAAAAPGPLLDELLGGVYPEKAKLIGQRTGEMHLALASEPEDKTFAPEPFNAMAQRSVYQSMRASLRRAFALLQKEIAGSAGSLSRGSDAGARGRASDSRERTAVARANRAREQDSHPRRLSSRPGALYREGFRHSRFRRRTGAALSERKLKRSALRDVAGMMRSFQYAAYSALWQPSMRAEDAPFLERWADLWYRQMSATFLESYLRTTAGATFLPQKESDLQVLLEAYLLDKAVYEVGYELNHRPDWVVIPIRGIKHILHSA